MEKELILLKQKTQLKTPLPTGLQMSSQLTQQSIQNSSSNVPLNLKSPNLPQNQQYYNPKLRSSSAKRVDSAERASYKPYSNDENKEDFSKKPPRRTSGLFSNDKRY